jgi:formylmethanofuran dehydrogenase subunit E
MLSYQDTIRFHGHNGPFLAVGYKLGRFLMTKLKPKSIMDIRITVITELNKPYTCVIDGLQCSTFATIGKGNITVKRSRGEKIIVSAQKGKKIIKFRLTERARQMCFRAEDLERAANKILRTPANQLWHRS